MKKLNVQKILFLFIIILPLLDMSSFIFRNFFGTSFSPSTFIRPIIPIILILFIFFKNKFKLKTICVGCIYLIYNGLHLYIFKKLNLDISYGNITHELQYIINYSFAILNLFIFIFLFYKKDCSKINKAVLIANGIYILSIFISILTKTSSSTYLEGIGYKGWFESGNAISSILILNLIIIFTLFNKLENKTFKIIALIETILSGIYLVFLLGTRTGLFGFVLVIGLFIFSKLFIFFRNCIINKNLTLKNQIILIVSCILIILVILFVVFKGSSLLARRKLLSELDNSIIDPATNEASHVTGDILNIKQEIEGGNVSEEYISKPMQEAILELYNFANEHNISLTNRRIQQLAYNFYLVKNQSNLIYILLGNGFLNNYGELILEMEIPAFLFNFGLIGFILYFVPFFALFIYYIIIGIKNIKKIDSEFIFLLCGIFLSFALSFLLGQIFFNSSAMIIISCINVLLFNKCIKLKEPESVKELPKEEEKILV